MASAYGLFTIYYHKLNMIKSILLASVMMMTTHAMALTPWEKGGFETGKYRNLFVEMGYSQAEVDAKLK